MDIGSTATPQPPDCEHACQAVLRSLPMWFGIEEALLMYARDTTRLPTLLAREKNQLTGFLTLQEHFPGAWEIHCIAVHAQFRARGVGRGLLRAAEAWLAGHDAHLLQVKTIAASSPSAEYAQTRDFYMRVGFKPLEVFPELWDKRNPCLQMIKVLDVATMAKPKRDELSG
jgi:ribosomal protein S18 acetylase RimI-like enzyme